MRIFLLVFTIALLTVSCKKESGLLPASDTISFNVNGQSYTTFFASGEMSRNNQSATGETYNSVGIVGKLQGLPFSLFQIFINTPDIPTPGTYNYQGNCFSNLPECTFLLFVRDATDDDEEALVVGDGDNSQLQVDFTSLEFTIGGRLKGTFTATLIDDDGNEEAKFTNGVFDVNITD